MFNEPDNGNDSSYGKADLGDAKAAAAEKLLAMEFAWARAARPSQPLTVGVWRGD